jgi:2'-5' RNA ligase
VPERRYAVIAEPELATPDRDWIEALRRRHDPTGQARVGPHLTLFFAAGFSDPAPLARAMERAAESHPAFDLKLAPVVVLPDIAGGAVVALAATFGRSECVALHDALYAGDLARHLRADVSYEPHLTLGRAANATDAQPLASAIAAGRRAILARIAALRLVELGERAAIPRLSAPLAGRASDAADRRCSERSQRRDD